MPLKKIPTKSIKKKSDWWIIDKLFQHIKVDLDLLNFPKLKQYWNFSVATSILLLMFFTGLFYTYKNRDYVYSLFPNTSHYVVATIHKVNIIPDLLGINIKNLDSKYNLSVAIASLRNTETETININTSATTSIKAIATSSIDKYQVESINY
ncbi:MAG: hypothetical protein KAR54_03060 [Candidatus Pacebacteria bacterium]|nr:hypothetical protein [Candidatus Paceibacterota bacterium]